MKLVALTIAALTFNLGAADIQQLVTDNNEKVIKRDYGDFSLSTYYVLESNIEGNEQGEVHNGWGTRFRAHNLYRGFGMGADIEIYDLLNDETFDRTGLEMNYTTQYIPKMKGNLVWSFGGGRDWEDENLYIKGGVDYTLFRYFNIGGYVKREEKEGLKALGTIGVTLKW